jgi:hypothetical protein
MKSHFKKMFNYDEYANNALLETIKVSTGHHKALQLMAHLLSAQRV